MSKSKKKNNTPELLFGNAEYHKVIRDEIGKFTASTTTSMTFPEYVGYIDIGGGIKISVQSIPTRFHRFMIKLILGWSYIKTPPPQFTSHITYVDSINSSTPTWKELLCD